MSLYESTFQTQEDDSSDMLQPSDMMGPDSIDNYQAQNNGMAKGSPTRALVGLWFAAVVAKWILAWIFRGNIKG